MFLINRGEIEGRLDPYFYLPEFVEYKKILDKLDLKPLHAFSTKIMSGPFGSSLKSESYQSEGIPFIRIKNIRNGEINEGDLVFITEEENQNIKNSELFSGDIVLSKIGTVGEVAIIPSKFYKCNISENNIGIRLKSETNKKFVLYLLQTDLIKNQFRRRLSGNVQKFLNVDTVKNINIPDLSKSKQLEIVCFLEKAHSSKKQKEAEAAALLASIDSYLLQELGITLPPASEKKTFFISRSKQLSGERFDPFYHQVEFKELDKSLQSCKYEIQHFSKLITYISSGATPLKSNSESYYTDDSENGIPLLRVQNITAEGLKLDDVIFINRETHEKDLKRSQVFSGDLLVTITGRIASSAVAPENFEGNINQHSVIVRTDNKIVLNEYLAIYFNSYLGQKFALRKTTGGTRPALDYWAIKSIKIPLPPPEKQTEIANHISAIRFSAKQLQQQAAAELEQAKQQVEKMILGE